MTYFLKIYTQYLMTGKQNMDQQYRNGIFKDSTNVIL